MGHIKLCMVESSEGKAIRHPEKVIGGFQIRDVRGVRAYEEFSGIGCRYEVERDYFPFMYNWIMMEIAS